MNSTENAVHSVISKEIEAWVDQYTDGMMSWASHKIGRKEIAEDIVQDVFVTAYQSYQNFEGNSSPKTWLYAILNRKIADYFRALYKGTRNGDDPSKPLMKVMFLPDGHWSDFGKPQEWSEDSHLLDNPEFQSTFSNCMQKLPTNWHAVIQYRFIEEKKSEDVCQELQITPTNLWQIMHRAKIQLRKCLETHWFAA